MGVKEGSHLVTYKQKEDQKYQPHNKSRANRANEEKDRGGKKEMGLKESYHWKAIVTTWFPHVQIDPEEVRGDVTIVVEDMCLRFYNYLKCAYSLRFLLSELRNHPGKIFSKFPRCSRYIVLADDPEDVPSSKRPTQKARDDGDQFTPQELEALGPLAYLSQVVSNRDISWMEERYASEAEAFNAEQRKKGNKEQRNAFKVFMNKLMNTRQGNRKLDVYHTVGREMIKATKEAFRLCGLERTMVLDGFALPADAEARRFLSEDADIIEAEFDSYVPGNRYPTDNVIVTSTTTRRSQVRYALGEADLKVFSWIFAELKGKKTPQTVWVCCYDTDSIPIILLNMYKLIDPDTGRIPHRIYLDLTYRNTAAIDIEDLSEEDQRLLKENPRGASAWTVSTAVWDMVALWRGIQTMFGRCFPGIRRPVETFCTLLVMGATDFVTRLTDTGISSLWEAFRMGGYALLSDAVHTRENPSPSSFPLSGTGLDPPRKISFDEDALVRFTRYLYMMKLTCTHGVEAKSFGFPSDICEYIDKDLTGRIKGKKERGKPKTPGLRDHERAFKKAKKEYETRRGSLLLRGGDPCLTIEQAKQTTEWFRMSDIYESYHETKNIVGQKRKALRGSSLQDLRPKVVRRLSSSSLPTISAISQEYTNAAKRKKSLQGKQIPSEKEVRGFVRRICWNIDYWSRAWHIDWQDRSVEQVDGKSISGWIITEDGAVERSNDLLYI
jgi:hypothetical protein